MRSHYYRREDNLYTWCGQGFVPTQTHSVSWGMSIHIRTVKVPSPCKLPSQTLKAQLPTSPKSSQGRGGEKKKRRKKEKLKPHLSDGQSLVLQTQQSCLLVLFCSTCDITLSGWEAFRNVVGFFVCLVLGWFFFLPELNCIPVFAQQELPSLSGGLLRILCGRLWFASTWGSYWSWGPWPTDNHRLITEPQEYWETKVFFQTSSLSWFFLNSKCPYG